MRSTLRPSWGVTALAVTLATVLCAPAAHAEDPFFPEGIQLSTVHSTDGGTTDVAENAAGDGVAAWTSFDQATTDQTLQVAFRTAGGPWSAAQSLTGPGAWGIAPRVGIDAAGKATVAWTDYPTGPGGDTRIAVLSHTRAGTTSPIRTYSEPERSVDSVDLAVSQGGRVVVAWNTGAIQSGDDYPAGPYSQVKVAVAEAGGELGDAVIVSGTEPRSVGSIPAVSVNDSGDAAVVFEGYRGTSAPGSATIQLVRSAARAGFTAPQGMPGTGALESRAPNVIVDPAGGSVVVWTRKEEHTGQPHPFSGQAVRVGPDGVVGASQTFTDTTAWIGIYPRLAIDGAGRVTAAWAYPRLNGPPADGLYNFRFAIETATAAPGGLFGPVQQLSDDAYGYPSVASEPGGQSVISWNQGSIITAWRAAGAGRFGPVQYVPSSGGDQTSVSFVRPGLATLLWSRFDGAFVSTSGPKPPDAPKPPVFRDTTKPYIGFSSVRRVLVKGSKGKQKARQIVASFALSEAATVTATITRTKAGVRRGTACVAPPRRPGKKKAKRCTRTLVVGKPISGLFPDGKPSTLTFAKAPPAGRYRVTLTARDAAGNEAVPAARTIRVR